MTERFFFKTILVCTISHHNCQHICNILKSTIFLIINCCEKLFEKKNYIKCFKNFWCWQTLIALCTNIGNPKEKLGLLNFTRWVHNEYNTVE